MVENPTALIITVYFMISFFNCLIIHMMFFDGAFIQTIPLFAWYCVIWPISYPIIALKHIFSDVSAVIKKED